jgi:hypothetical protein
MSHYQAVGSRLPSQKWLAATYAFQIENAMFTDIVSDNRAQAKDVPSSSYAKSTVSFGNHQCVPLNAQNMHSCVLLLVDTELLQVLAALRICPPAFTAFPQMPALISSCWVFFHIMSRAESASPCTQTAISDIRTV